MNREERRLVSMSNLDWFKNEIELVNEFLSETSVQLATVEAYDAKLTLLIEEQKTVELGGDPLFKETKQKILSNTIREMEKVLKEELKKLQSIKEGYMAEEILDTLETLTSVDEGEALSEEACDVMKKINLLMRKYDMGCFI